MVSQKIISYGSGWKHHKSWKAQSVSEDGLWSQWTAKSGSNSARYRNTRLTSNIKVGQLNLFALWHLHMKNVNENQIHLLQRACSWNCSETQLNTWPNSTNFYCPYEALDRYCIYPSCRHGYFVLFLITTTFIHFWTSQIIGFHTADEEAEL